MVISQYRFGVDHRLVNAVTHQDAYPLPRIDKTLDRLEGPQFFSTLDLQPGCWQVPVAEQHREKTAFCHSAWFLPIQKDALWAD